jgi:tRNA-dihydrouridine synthase
VHNESAKKIDVSHFRYVVAPMVNQSDLPFRMLCRRYVPLTALHSTQRSHSECNATTLKVQCYPVLHSHVLFGEICK